MTRKDSPKGHLLIVGALAALLATPVQAQVPQRRVDAVEWPKDYGGAAAPPPGGAFADVNGTYMPVLVPRQFLRFTSLAFVGEPLSYTVSIRGNGFAAAISATRVSFDDGRGDQKDAAAITKGMGEQSAFLSFSRYGAGYQILVECARAADARCATTAYVEDLAAGLEIVGGSRGDPVEKPPPSAGAPLPPAAPPDPTFRYEPAGALIPRSGRGVATNLIYAPDIRFPVEARKAYLNSQVWGIGGASGPRGSWADRRNYAYPWHDNFCESRSRATPICPGGRGHQGVDIRPNSPEVGGARKHWAVATEDGRITYIGSYSVTLTGASGTQYRYLHMKTPVAVRLGQSVSRGQRMGLISNNFGGTPTTIHLHFEMLQNQSGGGMRHVPPYTSLVEAYRTFR